MIAAIQVDAREHLVAVRFQVHLQLAVLADGPYGAYRQGSGRFLCGPKLLPLAG